LCRPLKKASARMPRTFFFVVPGKLGTALPYVA
jgi:hypothetical protein